MINKSNLKKPLFTVIIPTKDRAEYLQHTINTCLIQNYENLEILISDDASSDFTKDVVMEARRKDSRIHYISPKGAVGMRENFEFALNNVKPGFVIALGGDDGLLPYAIDGMKEAILDTGMQLLTWSCPIYSYAGAKTSRSQLAIHRKDRSRIVDSSEFLDRQVKNLNYISDPELPMFYVKGVTSTELIDRVKRRSPNGYFYNCATPDGYSGIVLAAQVESYAYSGKPFSIYGTSPSSQGLNYQMGGSEAIKQSSNFFRDASDWPMHQDLASQPYSPLISLMTADYLLSVKELPGLSAKIPDIDYQNLLERAVNELAHGLYAENRVARELVILHEIAKHHNLGDYFCNKVNSSKRYKEKKVFEGNGFNFRSLFLDCDSLGVKNILDASYLAYNLIEMQSNLKLSNLINASLSSIRYKLGSLKKGNKFPNI